MPTYTRGPEIASPAAGSYSSATSTINVSGRARLVRPLVEKLDFLAVPFQKMLDRKTIDNPKPETTDERFAPTNATIDGTGYASGATTIGVASGHAARLQKWDILKNGDERLQVTAITSDANITVVRGVGGTTAAALAANAVIPILAPAVPEKVDSPASPVARGDFANNFIQQFIYEFEASYIQDRTRTQYLVGNGGKGEYKWEMGRKLKEAARDLDRTLLYGVKNDATANSNPWMMGGLNSFITLNVTAKSGLPVAEADLMVAQQTAWSDVGPENMGRQIHSGIFLKSVFSSYYDGMRRADAQTTKIKIKIDQVENDLGLFEFVPNYYMQELGPGDLFGFDPNNLTLQVYDGLDWMEEPLAKTGAYERGHIVGVFSLEALGDRAHYKITGASTTRGDYATLP